MNQPNPIPGAIARIVEGQSLTAEEARACVGAIMSGNATDAQIGAFLAALRMKGETDEEIAGAARAMREAATPVRPARRPLVDTCGTGGDWRMTRNISTAAALVLAGGGAAVAKHGNRAITSRSGSADVLEALGVRIDLPAESSARLIDDVGIAFLFAPVLHPAMRHAIQPRREIGIRTLFNILGPITNPAGAERQVVGVFAPHLVPLIASVLRQLGAEHAIVVHGGGGEDELSLTPGNLAMESRSSHQELRALSIDAGELGLRVADVTAITGGDAAQNASWIVALLDGKIDDASRDTVVLNAAAAFYAAGLARDPAEGCARARESIDSGAAARVLGRLREASQKL